MLTEKGMFGGGSVITVSRGAPFVRSVVTKGAARLNARAARRSLCGDSLKAKAPSRR